MFSCKFATYLQRTFLEHLWGATSEVCMKQVITKPTHILESSARYIDLIFTNQPNMVVDFRVHSSLHEKCHYQTIYSKLNLKIEYSPPYIRKIWDYNRSETDSVNHSIEIFDWSYLFSGKKCAWTSIPF